MSHTKIGVPAAAAVLTLWDSGAMCSIATQATVPIGTLITPTRTKLTGATGTGIQTIGQATLFLEIGNQIFTQLCIIVPNNSITFPQKANLILGSNFLSANQLTLDTQLWAITHNNHIVTQLLPACIEGILYGPPQTDNANDTDHSSMNISTTTDNKPTPTHTAQSTAQHRKLNPSLPGILKKIQLRTSPDLGATNLEPPQYPLRINTPQATQDPLDINIGAPTEHTNTQLPTPSRLTSPPPPPSPGPTPTMYKTTHIQHNTANTTYMDIQNPQKRVKFSDTSQPTLSTHNNPTTFNTPLAHTSTTKDPQSFNADRNYETQHTRREQAALKAAKNMQPSAESPSPDPLISPYEVIPRASYEILPGINTIQIYIQHHMSDIPIFTDDTNEYISEQNMIQPGILTLPTIFAGKKFFLPIYNATKQTITIQRNIPIAHAFKSSPETQFVGLLRRDENEQFTAMSFQDTVSQTIFVVNSISDITPQADDGLNDDALEAHLNYDPANISQTEVLYDETRFQKLLEILQPDTWQIPESDKLRAFDVIRTHQRAFNLENEPLPKTHLLQHSIELENENDIAFTNPRWTPHKMRPPVEIEVGALLKLDLAYRSTSPHSSPIVLVRKRGKSNQYRLCVDFRKLNALTKPRFYPCKVIDEILFKVANAIILSILDMSQGYMQVGMETKSQPLSAFSTHLGSFAFNRMPFGLKNAAYTLSKLLDMVLGDIREFCDNYLDDIITYSNSVDIHFEHLQLTLQALIDANIQVSAKKAQLFRRQVKILGHTVGGGFIQPDHDKTQAVSEMPTPRNRRMVRSFLGMAGFFRKFIKGYANIAQPLTRLTSDNVAFTWGPTQQNAFEILKKCLCDKPILKAPEFDKCFYLITDASSSAIGAWLAQRFQGILHPISYFSRQLQANEKAWTLDAYEGEVYAIFQSLRKFRPFLYGARLIILSDSRALQWLFQKAQFKSPRLTRWALQIQMYGADILHLPGKANRPADCLSRYPNSCHPLHGSSQAQGATNPQTLGAQANPANSTLPQDRLDTIQDPTDKRLAGIAEFIIDGDPEQGNTMTLVAFSEAPHIVTDFNNTIMSIRTNTPDTEDTEEPNLWSTEEIKQEQRTDSLLKHIIKYIEKPNELNKMSIDPNIPDIHTYIIDPISHLLFKQQDDPKLETRGPEEVLVIPFSLQKRAMAAIHNSSVSGHQGPDRSIWSARRRFFWRHMDRHLKNFAATCPSCLKYKGTTHPPVAIRRYPIPDRPWEKISMDLVGRLPTTQKGNKFILVIVDFLTRYTVTMPLQTKSAKEVALALTSVFCEHGVPHVILSDNGLEFRNSVMAELSNILNFKHATIAVYHPASQGLVERTNQTIMIALRQLYDTRPGEWDQYLPQTTLAVNSAYNSNIGDTPFFLYRHRDPDTPLCAGTSPKSSVKKTQQYLKDEQERIKFAYDIVRQRLLESADRQVRTKDKKAKEAHIDVDDRVMVKYVKSRPGDNKLSPRFSGPYRVTAKKSPTVFKLKNLTTGKISEAHIENCKIVKERLADLIEFPNARLPLQEPETQPNAITPTDNDTQTHTLTPAKSKLTTQPRIHTNTTHNPNRRLTRAMTDRDTFN